MAALLLFTVVACGGSRDDPGTDPMGPDTPEQPGDTMPSEPQGDPRSYAMGWAPSAPRADQALLLAVIDSMTTVGEVAIVQQPVPWTQLLAGASMDSLVEDRGGLADYLRVKGMDVVWLVDPLQGLDRRKEDKQLVDAGRSILEPEIRAMHEDWVRGIAERVKPEWFGLASEINTLAALGDPDLYAGLVDMVDELAPEIRALSPGTRVFVSFQADQALGRLGDPVIDHFALIDDFDIDALGLSSYPGFAGFDTPADIPEDYLDPFMDATDLPLAVVEGGWSSEDTRWASSTPQEQAAYFDRYEVILDRIDARLWLGLTPTDLDVEALDLPPDQAQGLSNFAHMGIWDVDLERKPAYDSWARIHDRPPGG
jgi:hypothetical protein